MGQQRFGEQISLDSNYKIAKRRPKMEIDWLRKKFSHHYDDFEHASGSEDEEDEALFSDIHLQQTTMKKKTKKRKRKKKANNSQRNNVRKRKLSKLQSPRKPRTKKK